MKEFLVYCPDLGQSQENPDIIFANNVKNAAIKFIEECENDGYEVPLDDKEPLIVNVFDKEKNKDGRVGITLRFSCNYKASIIK